MATTTINLNGINAIDLTLPGTTTASVSGGITTVTNVNPGYSLGGTLIPANVTLGSGAGIGATFTVGGQDGNHVVAVTTGTSPAASAAIYTLTYTTSRGRVSFPVVSNNSFGTASAYTSLDQIPSIGTINTVLYTMESTTVPLAANTTYSFIVSCP